MRYLVQLHERMFRVSDTESGTARAPVNAKRGQVSGISRKSRYRLIKLLSQINRPDAPTFITLTYREFVEDFEVWKTHLDNFRRSLAYHFPDYCGVWRLEFQKRGAPHFHILAWLCREMPIAEAESLLSCLWLNAIGQYSKANQEYGCTVEPCTDFRRSAFYLSVYQAKDQQDRDDIVTGREWGVWKKERLNLAPVEEVALCANGLRLLRRIIRRSYIAHQRTQGRKVGGYAMGLRRDQPFSSFLPFHASRALVLWVRANADAITADNIARAQHECDSCVYSDGSGR